MVLIVILKFSDYAGGNRFSLEFEESSTKYEDLLQSLESESQQREFLINLLEDSEAYYQAALEEATIIANVCNAKVVFPRWIILLLVVDFCNGC